MSTNDIMFLPLFYLQLCILLIAAEGQGISEIGCFVAGECQDSLFVEVAEVESQLDCLHLCQVRMFPFW